LLQRQLEPTGDELAPQEGVEPLGHAILGLAQEFIPSTPSCIEIAYMYKVQSTGFWGLEPKKLKRASF